MPRRKGKRNTNIPTNQAVVNDNLQRRAINQEQGMRSMQRDVVAIDRDMLAIDRDLQAMQDDLRTTKADCNTFRRQIQQVQSVAGCAKSEGVGMKGKINTIVQTHDNLGVELSRLQYEAKSEFAALKSDISAGKTEISELKTRVAAQDAELERLKTKIASHFCESAVAGGLPTQIEEGEVLEHANDSHSNKPGPIERDSLSAPGYNARGGQVGGATSSQDSAYYSLLRISEQVSHVEKQLAKHVSLYKGDKFATMGKINAFCAIVARMERRQPWAPTAAKVDEWLQVNEADVTEWNTRYLNALMTGPSSSSVQNMKKYDQNLATLEQQLKGAGDELRAEQQELLVDSIHTIRAISDNTRESLISISKFHEDMGMQPAPRKEHSEGEPGSSLPIERLGGMKRASSVLDAKDGALESGRNKKRCM